jgi:hypothetical protein
MLDFRWNNSRNQNSKSDDVRRLLRACHVRLKSSTIRSRVTDFKESPCRDESLHSMMLGQPREIGCAYTTVRCSYQPVSKRKDLAIQGTSRCALIRFIQGHVAEEEEALPRN